MSQRNPTSAAWARSRLSRGPSRWHRIHVFAFMYLMPTAFLTFVQCGAHPSAAFQCNLRNTHPGPQSTGHSPSSVRRPWMETWGPLWPGWEGSGEAQSMPGSYCGFSYPCEVLVSEQSLFSLREKLPTPTWNLGSSSPIIKSFTWRHQIITEKEYTRS